MNGCYLLFSPLTCKAWIRTWCHSLCSFLNTWKFFTWHRKQEILYSITHLYTGLWWDPHSNGVKYASGHLFTFLLWIPLSFPLGICTPSEKTQGRDTECVMIGKSLKKALTSPVWKIAMPAKAALLLSYNHFRMTPWRPHSTKVKMISDGK